MIVLKVSRNKAFCLWPMFLILERAPGVKDNLHYGFNFLKVNL